MVRRTTLAGTEQQLTVGTSSRNRVFVNHSESSGMDGRRRSLLGKWRPWCDRVPRELERRLDEIAFMVD